LSASSPTESTIDRGVDFWRIVARSARPLGATATDFWDVASVPIHRLPAAIVMTADDIVDAALAGLDQGEVVTIPALADKADWDRYEAARRALSGKLSTAVPE
jgi:short-subunit dehydrogenase